MSELPRGWERATVGEVAAEVHSGFASGLHNTSGSGIPHLRPMNVSRLGKIDLDQVKYVDPLAGDCRLLRNDIIFNNTNSPALVGKTAIFTSEGEFAFSNHMTSLRTASGVDPKFVAHQLHFFWMTGQLSHLVSNHVNQASISTKVLTSQVHISVPPLAEQERIVAAIEEHLSRLDAATEVLYRIKFRLDYMAISLLDDALEGEPTPIGELLAEPLRNGFSAKAMTDGAVRVLTLTAVTKREFVNDNTKLIVSPSRPIDDLWLRKGDIFVQRSNTPELVGSAAIYKGPDKWAIFPDLLIRVRLCGAADPNYVELALRSHRLRRYFQSSARGIAGSMPKISQPVVEAALIPLPGRDRQENIAQRVNQRLETVVRQSHEVESALRRARILRRAILSAAFDGQLVDQDPSDEPASVLLDRIRAKRPAKHAKKIATS